MFKKLFSCFNKKKDYNEIRRKRIRLLPFYHKYLKNINHTF